LNRVDEREIELIRQAREIARLRESLGIEEKRRARAEEALGKRLRNEKIVDKISRIVLSGEKPIGYLTNCLEIMGTTLAVSRAYILEEDHQTDEGGPLEWVAPGITPQEGTLQPLLPGLTSWWRDMMKNRLIIRYRDVQDIPGSPDKEILRARGVQSILAVPLFRNGGFWGCMGLDECRAPRDWSDEEISLTRIISQIVSSALDRAWALDAVKESEKRYRSFVGIFSGITFLADLQFVPRFLHGAVEAITGYKEDTFTSGMLPWKLLIHPDDLPLISESTARLASIPGYSTEREYRVVRKDGTIRWVSESVRNILDGTGTPILVQGLIYDVTAVKRLQSERDRLLDNSKAVIR
jgi:PAS domain S-box-containing protein